MKILHICDVAGVSTTLARYFNLQGHKAVVFTYSKMDTFQFSKLYPEQIKVFDSFKTLLACALLRAKFFDVIHVHYYGNLTKWFKRLFPKKPVVLHYHGSDIRYKKEEKKEHWEKADRVLVSTPDLSLMYPDFVHLPNPVDEDHFTRKNNFNPETALFFQLNKKHKHSTELAQELAIENELKLTTITRYQNPVSYCEMPSILEKFEYFIDIKQEPLKKRLLDPLSLTALQALSMGTKVLNTRSVYSSLPEQHTTESVVKQLLSYYKELI